MAVLIEALSVIVRNATLESLYPGGVSGYAADCPNRTFCSDGVLTRVGFMAPDDVAAFLEHLEAHGLVLLRDGVALDVAVVDQFQGLTTVCNWLAFGADEAGVPRCWLSGSPPGYLSVPEGWEPGQRLTFVPDEEMERRLSFVESRDGTDVWVDNTTGKRVYIGRTAGTHRARQLAERLRLIGRELQQLEARIEEATADAGPVLVQTLQAAAIRLAERAEALAGQPGVMPDLAWHVVGLGHRVASQWERAVSAFWKVLEADSTHHAAHLELVWCLSELGRHAEALPYARRAVQLEPRSPGALGNLALCLINNHCFEEAKETIWKAVASDPEDVKNRFVLENFEEFVVRSRSSQEC